MFNCKLLLLFTLCLLTAACQQSGTAQSKPQGVLNGRSELAGSQWQLVIIQSMDDTQYTPQVREDYSLAFEPDGKLLLRAGCNRGSGNWTSIQAGELRFGSLRLTRLACPPGSIDSRFVSDLTYVRSYVLKDGDLFLATMADGAILQFEMLDLN